MSAKRTERLLTLVMLLLSRGQGWTKEELFREVEPYAEAATTAAREKLFDRDKAALREQGIPVESFSDDPLFDNDNTAVRYRINAEHYRLPGMSFTPAESVALSVAAGMWTEAALGGAAARALRKLRSRGVDEDALPTLAVEARIRTNEPFWDEVWQALVAKQTVRFRYRAANAGDELVRTVQPWGIGSRFGHWYLVGFDLDRSAERWFRLTRMTTPPSSTGETHTVPDDFSMSSSLATLDPGQYSETALVEIKVGSCQLLRTRPGATVKPGKEGWDSVEYGYSDSDAAAAEIAALGSNARVVAPASLAEDVKQRLTNTVRALEAEIPMVTFSGKARRAPHPAAGRSTEERLLRLLDLVPYFLNNPGVTVDRAASDFGVSPSQLINDVGLLFVSGPRYYPDGLIDIQLNDNRIEVTDPQGLGEPIRFGLDEACALLVGLHTLADLPGLSDNRAVLTALEKLRQAAGEVGRADQSVATVLTEHDVAPTLAVVRDGLEQRRQLDIRYVVASRDEVTKRTIEPLKVFLTRDTWYLEAWCHSAGGRRIFRLDRITDIEITDHPFSGQVLPMTGQHGSFFEASDSDEIVVLLLAPAAHWVAEAYGAERTAHIEAGQLAAEIRIADSTRLYGMVASLGGHCVIERPADLREHVLSFARDALANYL